MQLRKITKRESFFKRKKGVFALIMLIVILTVSAIFGLLTYRMVKAVNETYDDTGLFEDGSIADETNLKIKTTSKYGIDNMTLFLFLGSIIGLVFGAVRTRFSPILMFLFILCFLISIGLAAMSAEIYHGFATTGDLQETADELIFTKIIFSKYFPLMICIIGAVVMVVMWGKQGGEIIR